jgi:cell division protein FtsA
MKENSELIVGLDVGTTKVMAVIAEMGQEGKIDVAGVGWSLSEGLKRGMVVNLEKTVLSIKKAVAAAEQMAGVRVRSVFAGVSGEHVRSFNSRGVVAVTRSDREIRESEVLRVVEAARTIAIPYDREILHALPQEFMVDDQRGIADPLGMSGMRLEAEVHIVTGALTAIENVTKAVDRAGWDVDGLVLSPLAASSAVLTEGEKELGVLLLDVGGGTTDLALWYDGSVRMTSVIPLGGQQVTSDLAVGLRTTQLQAETIKVLSGCALADGVDDKEQVDVPDPSGGGKRAVRRQVVAAMIEPRLEEILALAKQEAEKSRYFGLLGAGVVVTGGTANMEGFTSLCEQVFDLPVRAGVPRARGGVGDQVAMPEHAAGVGLLSYGYGTLRRTGTVESRGGVGGLFRKVKSAIAGLV